MVPLSTWWVLNLGIKHASDVWGLIMLSYDRQELHCVKLLKRSCLELKSVVNPLCVTPLQRLNIIWWINLELTFWHTIFDLSLDFSNILCSCTHIVFLAFHIYSLLRWRAIDAHEGVSDLTAPWGRLPHKSLNLIFCVNSFLVVARKRISEIVLNSRRD